MTIPYFLACHYILFLLLLFCPTHRTTRWTSPTSPGPQTVFLATSELAAPESESDAAAHAATLLTAHATGTLCTVMRTDDLLVGHAYGSKEYYASCAHTRWDAHPVLFVSALSMNARQFLSDPQRKASLAVYNTEEKMDGPRVTLLGRLEPIAEETNVTEFQGAWQCFSSQHPDAEEWKEMRHGGHRFTLYRLRVERVYWIGGFGGQHYIGFINVDTYEKAFASKVSGSLSEV